MKNKRGNKQIQSDIKTQSKVCTGCKVRKDFSKYNLMPRSPDDRRPACVPCEVIRTSRWRKLNPEQRKKQNRRSLLRHWYGLAEEDYYDMLWEQDGKCYICLTDSPSPNENFAVDHNHSTGKIRGLLCNKCNRGLGYFKDDDLLLERAMNYIRRFKDD